jgi:hypothetical protein
MSGLEPIIAAEAAAATTAAATAEAATVAAAEIAAAEVAAAAAAEAAAATAATEAATTAAAAETAVAAGAPTASESLLYLDPQFAATNPFGMGPDIAFSPELAGENLVSQAPAGVTLSPEQAQALEQFGSSAGESLLSAEMTPQQYMAQQLERASALNSYGVSTDAMLQQDLVNQELARQKALEGYGQSAAEMLQSPEPTLFDQAWQKTLTQGMDADLPGATMRSIQAGFQNNPLGTIGSLPQYLGMPASPPGAGRALQAAQLLSPPQQGGTRTNVAPPMLNRGKEVSLAAPVLGLLGGAPMPKRRRLSLI